MDVNTTGEDAAVVTEDLTADAAAVAANKAAESSAQGGDAATIDETDEALEVADKARLIAEAKRRRLENKDLKAKLEELTKSKDEGEKTLAERLEAMEAELQAARDKQSKALYDTARNEAFEALKVSDPETFELYLEKRADEILRDEDGKPLNILEIATEIAVAKPHLTAAARATTNTGSAANASRQGTGKAAFTPESIAAMSESEIIKHLDDPAFNAALRTAN